MKEYSILLNLIQKNRYYDFNFDIDDNNNHDIQDIIDLGKEINHPTNLKYSHINSTTIQYNKVDNNSGNLFLNKIWRNIFLKNQIYYHLKLYIKVNDKWYINSKDYSPFTELHIQYGKSMGITDYINYNMPNSVSSITFLNNEQIYSNLPYQISHISICNKYNYIMKRDSINWTTMVIPNTIESVTLDFPLYHSINKLNIPNSVKSISILSYHHPFKITDFPKSVTFLNIGYINEINLKRSVFSPNITNLIISNEKIK